MGKTMNNQVVEAPRNPAEPVGNPPGGGRWTWDIPNQVWVDLDAPVVANYPQLQVAE